MAWNQGKNDINLVKIYQEGTYVTETAPILGKYWFFYPICLLINILYLLTHKVGSFFSFVFKKEKNRDIYKKIGI